MSTGLAPICFACARLIGVGAHGWCCEAYPVSIPIEILVHVVDHHRPVEGDHGLQFVPRGSASDDAGTSEGARKGWLKRQRGGGGGGAETEHGSRGGVTKQALAKARYVPPRSTATSPKLSSAPSTSWHLSVIDPTANKLLFHGTTTSRRELHEAAIEAQRRRPGAHIVIKPPMGGATYRWRAPRVGDTQGCNCATCTK